MNALVLPAPADRQTFHRWLARHGIGASPNREWLSRILASWCAGESALPDFLGLEPGDFRALQARYFPGIRLTGRAPSGRRADFSRMPERDDLLRLLLSHASRPDAEETNWLARIVVAGSLGSDHLWQDVGLWSRKDLSRLIADNFPQLAALNTQDMKWKKFLYKQLCAAEGIYVCRAPSCDVCADYPVCFGPEE